jgi:hypothetical protein
VHSEIAHLLAEQIHIQRSAGQLPPWVSPAAMAQLIVAVIAIATLLAMTLLKPRKDQA